LFARLLLILLLVYPDSSTLSEMRPKPADFSVAYEWQKESVPPPHHYEYTIRIGPGSRGEILFFPDYLSNNPPVWKETFNVSDKMSSDLYALMARNGVFSRNWRRMDEPPIGGSLERLKVTAHGMQFSVPSPVISEQSEASSEVYSAIRSALPETVWAKLMELQKDYERKYMEKDQLFDFILTLGDQDAFTAEKLSSLTSIPLKYVPPKKGSKFLQYYSLENCKEYHPYIKKMELRAPCTEGNWRGLIIIELNNTLGVTATDVYARFGDVARLGVPDPDAPEDEPLYLVYKFDWGDLSFGISREQPNLLVQVLLDAHKQPSLKKLEKQRKKDTPFPLPENVQNFTKSLKSNQINFQTHLSLKEIVSFYRQAFTEKGYTEYKLLTVIEHDFISLAFEGLSESKIIVLQAVNLCFGSSNDARNVNIRTENGQKKNMPTTNE
jgi:hypothetical protein